jgi:hypothetical protein
MSWAKGRLTISPCSAAEVEAARVTASGPTKNHERRRPIDGDRVITSPHLTKICASWISPRSRRPLNAPASSAAWTQALRSRK